MDQFNLPAELQWEQIDTLFRDYGNDEEERYSRVMADQLNKSKIDATPTLAIKFASTMQ